MGPGISAGPRDEKAVSPLGLHAPHVCVHLFARGMIQGAERLVEGISMNRKLLPMLVCGLLVHTALCGCAAKPQTEQDKAVAEIKKLGGNVTLDEKGPDAAVIGAILVGTKVTDAKLEHLKGLTQLQTLNLMGAKITDAGLAHLKGLTQLQTLTLDGTRVTDAGLAHLKGLTQLQQLYVGSTQVTDAGIDDLKKALPNCSITPWTRKAK